MLRFSILLFMPFYHACCFALRCLLCYAAAAASFVADATLYAMLPLFIAVLLYFSLLIRLIYTFCYYAIITLRYAAMPPLMLYA